MLHRRLVLSFAVAAALLANAVTAEFSGQSTPIANTTLLFIEEHATIRAGTGRFSGATGEFVAYRFFDTAAGTTIGWFDGSITRAKGKR